MTQTHLAFALKSEPACVCSVRQQIETACRENGFNAATAESIGLCVNEALANVIHHAYDHTKGYPIDLTVDFDVDALKIVIRDWGSGVDPTALARRNDLTEPGGLGLKLMRQIMDRVDFQPQDDGMVLTMTRRKQAGT